MRYVLIGLLLIGQLFAQPISAMKWQSGPQTEQTRKQSRFGFLYRARARLNRRRLGLITRRTQRALQKVLADLTFITELAFLRLFHHCRYIRQRFSLRWLTPRISPGSHPLFIYLHLHAQLEEYPHSLP